MENISIGLTKDLLVDRPVINVNFRSKIMGCVSYTDKRHNGVGSYILAKERFIGINKSKRTLESTTQERVRSAIKNSTGLLSQRL